MNRRNVIKNTGLIAGVGLLGSSMMTILQSCQNESHSDWQPLFFTSDESAFVSSLLDTLLPRTDTPGALDVKTDIFIDKIIATSYDSAGQQKIRKQMATFNQNCEQQFGAVFSKLAKNKKEAALKKEESNSGKLNKGIWGKSVGEPTEVGFYRSFKSMAVWAYLSSEKIGKEVLSYDPIPQAYNGCIPVSEVGNKWSL